MTASASQDAGHEDLPRSLARFAKGLSAGTPAVPGAAGDGRGGFRPVEAVTEALAAAAGERGPQEARRAAYRALVRRFLRETEGREPRTQPAQRRAPQPVHSGAAAMRAHPAPEPSRILVALAGLAGVERAALILVAVERFTWREAADFMEIPEAELASALARAREAFAARLAATAAPGRPHLRLVE